MKKKARIAIVGDFPIGKIYDKFPNRTYGYPTWLFNLYNGFANVNDFDIHWICIDRQVKTRETFVKNNQTFHLIPATSLTVGLYTGYIVNRLRMLKCIHQIKPDLVHAWGTESFYGFAAKDFRGKTLLSIQGILTAISERAPLSSFEYKHKLYEPGVIRASRYITTESPWAADRIREISPHASIINWEYAVESSFTSIKRKLTHQPTCILIGNNTAVKNVPMAIEAFSRPELSNVKLWMVGIPKNAYSCLPRNIVPLGKIDRDTLVSYLSRSWALIHTSFAETGPTVVKEARAAALPVILTSECGSKQHIVNDKSGYIIQSNDVQSLVEAVLKITKDSETNIEMGKFNHDKCLQALSIESMISNIVCIYKRILSN